MHEKTPRGHWLITTYNTGSGPRTTGMSIERICSYLRVGIALRHLNRVGVLIEDENGTKFWMRDKKSDAS